MHTLENRFWAKVDKSGACWLWTGSLDSSGYGLFRVVGRLWKAHRFSVVLSGTTIPVGMVVRHTCDTPACVNPAHLIVGTSLENAHDRDSRGRAVRGRGNQRLTTARAALLRERFARGARAAELAAEFGISSSHVYRVARGETTYV